ncbi:unnamed protein product [Sphagnum tenellum]
MWWFKNNDAQNAETIDELRGEVRRLLQEAVDSTTTVAMSVTTTISQRYNDYQRLVNAVMDHAIFMLDVSGSVKTWNTDAAILKGYSEIEIIGKHFSIFYTENEKHIPAIALKIAAETGHYQTTGWRVRKDGSRFWAVVAISPVFENNMIVGYTKITRNLSDIKLVEQNLATSERKFEILVEHVVDYAIFLLDPKGVIISWNVGAERIKGYSAEEVTGRNFSMFYTKEDRIAGLPQHGLDMALQAGSFSDEGWRVCKNGTLIWMSVSIASIIDEDGGLVGFAKIEHLDIDGYETVVKFYDDEGFRAYIALHNTKLGPALGGCRIKSYTEYDAELTDVLRLAKGMTYKSSLAGLSLGGGKMVVNAPYATREIMLKVGEAVNYFGGDYITAEDMGTTLEDINVVSEVSSHTIHRDGSSLTAKGVMVCMQAALRHIGYNSFTNVPIWVQGLGKVGFDLVERITGLGDMANIFVSDLCSDVVERSNRLFGTLEIDEEMIWSKIAVYAPCAMGQVINKVTVGSIPYSIICGAANNQLVKDEYADRLQENGVLYCPDWLVNAGGVIAAACEVGQDYDADKAEAMTDDLADRLLTVLEVAQSSGQTPLAIATEMAEARFL